MDKEQAKRWGKLQGSNKSGISFYSIGLWLILIVSLLNGFSIGAGATSAIHQIYGGISFIIAALMFCALAIRAKISESNTHLVDAIRTNIDKVKED